MRMTMRWGGRRRATRWSSSVKSMARSISGGGRSRAAAARRVTAFTNDELVRYAWTADGRLFYTRWQTLSVDVVLITNFR